MEIHVWKERGHTGVKLPRLRLYVLQGHLCGPSDKMRPLLIFEELL